MNSRVCRLCPARPISKCLARNFSLFVFLLGTVMLGCERTPQTASPSPSADSLTSPSIIPLRIWIVAPIGDEQIWLRQWLTGSEQPLELRSLKVDELLLQKQCDCDVLLYPARLIGELAQRDWIVKLPDNANAVTTAETVDDATASAPFAWRQQASYAGETMAVPLGCAVPVFLASSKFPSSDHAIDWNTVLDELRVTELDAPRFEFTPQQTDREALVDRFLAIVATLSSRDPSYGLLFDLQTMQSRLADGNFVRAAKILAALASQPDGLASVIEDHSAAWSWAASNQRAAVAIAAPALIDSKTAIIPTGQTVRIGIFNMVEGNQASVANNISLSTAATDQPATVQRPRVLAWNSGAGLLASLSSQCRQSNQATALLRWLSQPSTRTVLAKFASGIESPTPATGTESLAWKARQSLSELVSGVGVAHEPRLPLATEYREALADELIEFLSGQSTASQALQSADKRWQTITDQAGETQRRNYEKSLGLTL